MVVATSMQPVAFTTYVGRFIALMVILAVTAPPQPAHMRWPGPTSSSTCNSFKVTIYSRTPTNSISNPDEPEVVPSPVRKICSMLSGERSRPPSPATTSKTLGCSERLYNEQTMSLARGPQWEPKLKARSSTITTSSPSNILPTSSCGNGL